MIRIGDTAVVTGAAKGIGKGIATALAREGVKVCCLDKDDLNNELTVNKINEDGGKAFAMHCDLADPRQIDETFDSILKEDRIDILVNNVGVFIGNSYLKGTFEEALKVFDEQMAVNARATYLCTKKVAVSMAKRGSGQILNIITNHLARNLYRPSRSEQAYDASKWAQFELNESMDRELKEYGIRVNALCPASTRTAMLQDFFDKAGIELNRENVFKVTHFDALLEIEDLGKAAVNVLSWDEQQPTGNAYLLIYPEDCESLKEGHQEKLRIRRTMSGR